MHVPKRIIDFFVYSNLFIAGCAVVMAMQTYQLILHQPPDLNYLGFVFFSSITSYSFHWYLTLDSQIPSPRIAWLNKYKNVHLFLFFIGIAGSAYFFLMLLEYWPWLILGAFITFLYSAPKIPHPWFRALRRIAIGKTIFLAGVWTFVTTVLPVVTTQAEHQGDFFLFICSRFFLIYAICILFDYRDRFDDRAKGIRSLITYMSETGIRNLFLFSLMVYVAATVAMQLYGHSVLIILMLLVPGIITAALYNHARRNFSDMLFYFVLDGLMALSSVLTLLAWI